jgi:hypothetical protein
MKIFEVEQARYAYDNLQDLKMLAHRDGEYLSKTLQLFVPRPAKLMKRSDRIKDLIGNKYAWTSDTSDELTPQYQNWVNQGVIGESIPILKPGKATPAAGGNKPISDLWTSTAIKTPNGYTSDWVQWVINNQQDWYSDTGYLYKVKPGALVLELNNQYDAQRVYHAFENLGRISDTEKYKPYSDDPEFMMRVTFPWDQIAKHFDAVYHNGHSYRDSFMYGWDVESTAWLNTEFLQLIGPVKIDADLRDNDEDY